MTDVPEISELDVLGGSIGCSVGRHSAFSATAHGAITEPGTSADRSEDRLAQSQLERVGLKHGPRQTDQMGDREDYGTGVAWPHRDQSGHLGQVEVEAARHCRYQCRGNPLVSAQGTTLQASRLESAC